MYTNAIHQVQSDENKLAHLMKDNIHVIKSTISTFNNSMSKVNENENRLNINLQIIEKSLQEIGNSNDKLEIKSKLSLLLNSLESIIISLSFDIDDLNNAILFSKNNVLHPTVLSPYKLFTELDQNKNNLPKHCELPVTLSLQNIHEIIDISSLVCFYNYNKIILVLRIPLVLPQTYNLFHVIPLPVPYDVSKPDTFALVAPSKSYIAITNDRMFYSLFDNLDNCKSIGKKCFVCVLESVFSTIANPTCETVLISEVITTLPRSCETKLLHGSIDIFHKLNNNRWIFVQSEPGKCHITCESEPNNNDEILFGTGILSIPKNCKAFFKTLQFSYSESITTNISLYISNFTLIDDDCCEKTKINKTLANLPFVKLSNVNNLNSLLHASIQLNDLEKELNKLENPSHLVKYSTHYLSAIYVLIGLVLLYMCIRIRKLFCLRNPNHCVQIYNQCKNRKSKHSSLCPVQDVSLGNLDTESSSQDEDIRVKAQPTPVKIGRAHV